MGGYMSCSICKIDGQEILGYFLTAAVIGALVIVVFILGAFQFGDTIRNSAIKDPVPNVGNVRLGVSTLEGSYDRSASLEAQRDGIESQIQTLQDSRLDVDNSISALQQNVFTYVQGAASGFSSPELASIPFPPPADGDTNNYLKIRDVFARYRAQVAQKIAANSDAGFRKHAAIELANITSHVDQLLAGYNDLLTKDRNEFFKVQNLEMYGLKDIEKKRQAEIVTTKTLHDGFRDLCEEILTYKSLFGRLAYEMIFIPKSSLTLVLAVAMGLLGSLIYLTRERVMGGTKFTLASILFRASLGCALAVAIYVFAAAGMFALGQHPVSSNGGADMSPYLISFIGITAGYLSDHMAAWMAQIGRQTFKIDGVEGKERWAPHLTDYMNKKPRTAADIANWLKVAPTQVAAWIANTQPIPPDTQIRLADYLECDIDDLFTDIPPKSAR
jgi:hypothetical protein